MKSHTPAAHAEARGYTHGVEVDASRLLFISGQTPKRAGHAPIATDPAEQIRQIWSNIGKVLAAAGADFAALVHVRAFLASRDYREVFREVRDEVLGEHKPAITVVICGIYDDAWVAEVEAVAELPAAVRSGLGRKS